MKLKRYYKISWLNVLWTIWIGLMSITRLHGQTAYTEVLPSPTVQQFMEASGNNSLQTGQLSVSIPLFNLQCRGINVPVSAYFSGAGITHQSEESELGLGWTLSAGGLITQTIRGYNDLNTTSSGGIPAWRTNPNYLQDKWAEEQNNPYNNNILDGALDQLMGSDEEPDEFKYSFQGHSGDLYFDPGSAGNAGGTLYPDKSFKISKTTAGFQIIANDGTKYIFETRETTGENTTSWFLTELRTMQGGTVTFQYTDVTKYRYNGIYNAAYITKELSRIDYDYGYVTFSSGHLKSFNSNGQLIRDYEFVQGSGNPSNSTTTSRAVLQEIRIHGADGASLPPYKFEYDYYFRLDQSSSGNNGSNPLGTWAHNPNTQVSADRNLYGQLSPHLETTYETTPEGPEYVTSLQGITYTGDNTGADLIGDFLCMTRMTLPSGGIESYYYEPHDYGFFATSQDTIKPGIYYDQHNQIMGRRLRQKDITDGNGHTQIVEYKYCLHDENYNPVDDNYFQEQRFISSGVLINPSVHTSTLYQARYDNQGIVSGIEAILNRSQYPQNSLSGQAIYYTQVEEIFRSEAGGTNGKKIYYFDRMYALPSSNYAYLDYKNRNPSLSTKGNALIGLPNTLLGKQTYLSDNPQISGLSDMTATYLAYPVGRFYQSDLLRDKLLKEVTLGSGGNVVRKIENEYTPGYGAAKTLYGFVVKKYDDNDYSVNPYPAHPLYRYLIAQTTTMYGLKQLLKRTITDYLQSGPVTSEQTFQYSSLNLLKSSTTTLSGGGSRIKEYVYPGDIDFQTTYNLSAPAAAIQAMKDKNMTGVPVQTTVKQGAEYIAGSYTTFKQLPGGAIVTDTLFSLANQAGSVVSKPVVSSSGKVERNSNFKSETAFLSYDANANPTTAVSRDGTPETTLWGYGGQYPVAKVENAEFISGNSGTGFTEYFYYMGYMDNSQTYAFSGSLSLWQTSSVNVSRQYYKATDHQSLFLIKIYDAAHHLVKDFSDNMAAGSGSLNLTDQVTLPAGTYTVEGSCSYQPGSSSYHQEIDITMSGSVSYITTLPLYTSFEEDQTGTTATYYKTGKKSHSGSYTLTLPPCPAGNNQYLLTYWIKQSAGSAWEQVKQPITIPAYGYTTTIGTSASYIDEIRVYPENGLMATYTYDPLTGVTSKTDAKDQTGYYAYDSFQRLSSVKDHNGDVVKQYCYNYAGQPQACPVITPPSGIYVRVELSNSQTISGDDYTVVIAEVKYRFYSDAACTQSYTLTAPLTLNTGFLESYSNNGGLYHQYTESGTTSVPAGVSEMNYGVGPVEQSLYYETGTDPLLGTLYEYLTSEYLVQPGDGYVVVQ